MMCGTCHSDGTVLGNEDGTVLGNEDKGSPEGPASQHDDDLSCSGVESVKVGTQFESFDELEKAIEELIANYHHPLRRYNSQTVQEYNRRREKAGSLLRIEDKWKYAFISYR